MTVQLLLNALPGDYAVSRCAPHIPVPDWVHGPGLVSVTQAPDETSILCRADRVPDTVQSAPGWSAVQVSNLVDLDVPGVVLSAVRPVSEAGLGVFVTSTFDRDYLLVRSSEEFSAQAAWIGSGHTFVSEDQSYRLADANDSEALAFLHFCVWQQTYASIAPPEVRLELNLKRRTAYWERRLGEGAPTLIAEQNGEAVGLCALSPAGVDGFECDMEIAHLYVKDTHRGQRLGQRLLNLAIALAGQSGFAGLVLAVVRENTRALAFYRRNGGEIVAERTDKGPLWKSENLILRWDLGA